ncbi:hypothetical protein DJ90_5999 [Paenibacillus macerans]|uniref:Uncharacterized protein n=1 Tax=Paenibacillus macerans TaxID=44252 RepID=A0A090Y4W3_PAEMA|nr:hypothetical protein DJ90_5999 [Paenibacillus macerans]
MGPNRVQKFMIFLWKIKSLECICYEMTAIPVWCDQKVYILIAQCDIGIFHNGFCDGRRKGQEVV